MHALKTIALCASLPSCLCAQAWLSPDGQGTVSLLYQYGFDRYHAFSHGETQDRGHMYSQALLLDVDYSFTDRLAVRMSLPFIEGKYDGTNPHTLVRGQPSTAVAIDDGSYHGGFQDFRFDVRYNVSRRKVMLTPFVEGIVPSNSYPTFGHAAIGLGQREIRMGVNAGRSLGPFLPKAFFQGRYGFGFLQQVYNVAPKRSYAEGQLGYLLSRHLSIQGSTVWTHSFNGIDLLYGIFPNNLTDQQWLNHDRISRIELVDLGSSATYSINRSTSLFFGWGRSVFGENTHLRSLVTTVGFTKAFSMHGENPSATAASPQSKKALVCTCDKMK